MEVIVKMFIQNGSLEASSNLANSSSQPHHIYPGWFENSRHQFESEFHAQAISNIAGEILQQPILDAIGVGRRIRPTLFLAFLTEEIRRSPESEDISLAIAIELFHAASIIVDDLADKEAARRDKLPLYLKHGHELAFLSSHALVAGGYSCLSKTRNPVAVISLWNRAYLEACFGQSLDYRFGQAATLQSQQELSLKKTEAFFGFVGAGLDLITQRDVFETQFRVLGRVFQVSNDVIDLLSMDASSRMIQNGYYPLRLSFLVPRLVDIGLINRDEIFATHPVERLHEIASEAKKCLPPAQDILREVVQDSLLQIRTLALNDVQINFCHDFIEQCCSHSFWNHDHEAIA